MHTNEDNSLVSSSVRGEIETVCEWYLCWGDHEKDEFIKNLEKLMNPDIGCLVDGMKNGFKIQR
jgi:hypothetical protein